MMKKSAFLFIYVFVFLLSEAGLAADARLSDFSGKSTFNKEAFMASAKTDKVLRIGLVDCIAYALKNNSEIKIERIEPKLKKEDVKIANADFEPTLNLDMNIRDDEDRTTNMLFSGGDTTVTKDIDVNAGIEGRLITGTEYNLEFLTNRNSNTSPFDTINPSYEVQPKITITQPIFGEYGIFICRADIVIARNNKEISQEDFEDLTMDILSKTKTAYYKYFYHIKSYAIAISALARAQNLFEINKARYAKGLVSSVDLLESEAAVAEKEKIVITTESRLKDAEDDLKFITNLVDDPETWNARVELMDGPDVVECDINLLESLQNAFNYRPDYESAKIDLKNRDVKVKVAKNDILPTLDLIGSFGLNGIGESYKGSIEQTKLAYKDWSMGAKFSLPWGEGDRANYRQRKMEKAQALLAFKRLEQDIILDVRNRAREVETQRRQIGASMVSWEKEKENYTAQEERYAVGQVSTHDMLDYQDKLAFAEFDYLTAVVDYNIAIVDLDKAEGLTLVKNDIILEE